MLLLISRNEDRPELESKILAAAFKQSVDSGDINGSRLAHRELVGLLARKAKGTNNGSDDELLVMFATDNAMAMDLQALAESPAALSLRFKKLEELEEYDEEDEGNEYYEEDEPGPEEPGPAELLIDMSPSPEASEESLEPVSAQESESLVLPESAGASPAEPISASDKVETSNKLSDEVAEESPLDFGSLSSKLGLEPKMPEPEWDPHFDNSIEEDSPAPVADVTFVMRTDKITGSIKKPVIAPKPPEPEPVAIEPGIAGVLPAHDEPEPVANEEVEEVDAGEPPELPGSEPEEPGSVADEEVKEEDVGGSPAPEDPEPVAETISFEPGILESEQIAIYGDIQGIEDALISESLLISSAENEQTANTEFANSEHISIPGESEIADATITFEQGAQPVDYLDFGGEQSAESGDEYQPPPVTEVYAQIDFGDDVETSAAENSEAPALTISSLLSQRPPPDPEAFGYYPWIGAEATDSSVLVHICYLRAVRRMLRRQFGEDRTQSLNPPIFKRQLRNMGVAYNILFDPVTRLDYDLRQLGLREPDAGSGLKVPADARLPDLGGKVKIAFSELLILCRIFDSDQMLAIVNAARLLNEQQFLNYLAESGLLTEVELDSIRTGFQLVCNGLISIVQFEQAFQYVRANQQQILEIVLAATWVQLDDLQALLNPSDPDAASEAPVFVEVEVQPLDAAAPVVAAAPPMPDWMDWGDGAPAETVPAAETPAEAVPTTEAVPASETASKTAETKAEALLEPATAADVPVATDDLTSYLSASSEGIDSLQTEAEVPPPPAVQYEAPLVSSKPEKQEKPAKKTRAGKAGKSSRSLKSTFEQRIVPQSLAEAIANTHNAENSEKTTIESVPNSLFEALSAAKTLKDSAKDKRPKYKSKQSEKDEDKPPDQPDNE